MPAQVWAYRFSGVKILHLDIETAPHKVFVWGLYDQNIALNQIDEPGYTLCWAAAWHGKRTIIFDSIKKSGIKKMVKHVHRLLGEADAVVHYNGKKFDIPTLNSEFTKFGLAPPSPYYQIDLYSVVRGKFKFASHKLDWVCQELDLGAKVQHKGMDLWRECMAGNEASWKTMERYNKQDVRLLPKLYEHLLPWIDNHPNWGNYIRDGELPVCRNCGSTKMAKAGVETRTIVPHQRYKCQDCRKYTRGRQKIGNSNPGLTL